MANQKDNIQQQLEKGIRSFALDIYRFQSPPRATSWAGKLAQKIKDKLVGGADDYPDSIYFCHAKCLGVPYTNYVVPRKSLKEGMTTIVNFLKKPGNENEFIIITFEDYPNGEVWDKLTLSTWNKSNLKMFEEVWKSIPGLTDLIYPLQKVDENNLTSEPINLVANGGGSVITHTVENHWDSGKVIFGYNDCRVSPKSDPLNTDAHSNAHRLFVMDQFSGPCATAATRLPNIISFDWTEIGDAMRIADDINYGVITLSNQPNGWPACNSQKTSISDSSELIDSVDIALDSKGNKYIADYTLNAIFKIAPGTNTSVLVAGGDPNGGFIDGALGTSKLNTPLALAIDSADNVYIVDQANHAIRKLDANGNLTMLTGKSGIAGGAADAMFHSPCGIAINGNNIYIGDSGDNAGKRPSNNDVIRKINLTSGEVTIFAGTNGVMDTRVSGAPTPCYLKIRNNQLWVADTENYAIHVYFSVACSQSTVDYSFPVLRKIPAGTKNVVDEAGNAADASIKAGKAADTRFTYLQGMTFDKNSNLLIANSLNYQAVGNSAIYKMDATENFTLEYPSTTCNAASLPFTVAGEVKYFHATAIAGTPSIL
ncbi:hypothetical protein ACTFIZ_012350 [Dictyostelium cf. discoideum]